MLLVLVLRVGASDIKLDFFYQPGCDECAKVKALVLPRLEDRFNDRVELICHDTSAENNFLLLISLQEKLEVDDNSPVCIFVNRNMYLGGFDEIDRRLETEIANAMAMTQPTMPELRSENALEFRAAKLTLAAVISAGLIDGVNPCVFSTLVFFMSLLSLSKIRGRQLLLIGSVYCLASFITYVLLGLGLIKALRMLAGLGRKVDLIMVTALIVFAVLSFVDAFKFRASGDSSMVALKIPEKIKARIHAVMRRGLLYRWLLPGVFGVGVLVTLLESVCTGQVYLPTMALMAKRSGGVWIWWLLLYNLMFILPLLAIFALAYRGVNSIKWLAWSRRNVVWGKLLLGVLFASLALLLWLFR